MRGFRKMERRLTYIQAHDQRGIHGVDDGWSGHRVLWISRRTVRDDYVFHVECLASGRTHCGWMSDLTSILACILADLNMTPRVGRPECF